LRVKGGGLRVKGPGIENKVRLGRGCAPLPQTNNSGAKRRYYWFDSSKKRGFL